MGGTQESFYWDVPPQGLSPPQRPLCVAGRLGERKKKAREARGPACVADVTQLTLVSNVCEAAPIGTLRSNDATATRTSLKK